MIGYDLIYTNKKTLESDIITNIFVLNNQKLWKNFLKKCIKEILENDFNTFELYLYTNEYFGDLKDHDFNDVLNKTEITNLKDFIDLWDTKTRKLIPLKYLKMV